MIKGFTLIDFVRESNRIEGISREPAAEEIDAHHAVIDADFLDIACLEKFVGIIQPGAVLRFIRGLDVRVGSYIPPPGGPEIYENLGLLLKRAPIDGPYLTHVKYELLHPFTDGNGRSGRALWLRQMKGKAPLGFLHHFYYQALENLQR